MYQKMHISYLVLLNQYKVPMIKSSVKEPIMRMFVVDSVNFWPWNYVISIV